MPPHEYHVRWHDEWAAGNDRFELSGFEWQEHDLTENVWITQRTTASRRISYQVDMYDDEEPLPLYTPGEAPPAYTCIDEGQGNVIPGTPVGADGTLGATHPARTFETEHAAAQAEATGSSQITNAFEISTGRSPVSYENDLFNADLGEALALTLGQVATELSRLEEAVAERALLTEQIEMNAYSPLQASTAANLSIITGNNTNTTTPGQPQSASYPSGATTGRALLPYTTRYTSTRTVTTTSSPFTCSTDTSSTRTSYPWTFLPSSSSSFSTSTSTCSTISINPDNPKGSTLLTRLTTALQIIPWILLIVSQILRMTTTLDLTFYLGLWSFSTGIIVNIASDYFSKTETELDLFEEIERERNGVLEMGKGGRRDWGKLCATLWVIWLVNLLWVVCLAWSMTKDKSSVEEDQRSMETLLAAGGLVDSVTGAEVVQHVASAFRA